MTAFLKINVDETKEMLINFGRSPVALSPAYINDQPVEQVEQYKYLGTVIDSKLSFEPQVDAVCKKAHRRLQFFHKLRNFNVNNYFMKMFYSCFIESVLTFSFICWHGSLSIKQQNRVNDIVKVCSKIAGTALNGLSQVYRDRCVRKAKAIIAHPSHPIPVQLVFITLLRLDHADDDDSLNVCLFGLFVTAAVNQIAPWG